MPLTTSRGAGVSVASWFTNPSNHLTSGEETGRHVCLIRTEPLPRLLSKIPTIAGAGAYSRKKPEL